MMEDNFNNKREYDAVLGGQAPISLVKILGFLDILQTLLRN
jgi:hypothetical protein